MKFKHFAGLALVIFICGSFATVQAQSHPFSWKTTSDPWYMSETYTFKFAGDEFTAKGASRSGHGPVCTNGCLETTRPDACTENLIKTQLTDIELPNYAFPAGYSGVEYVTFEVQTNGKVNTYQVVKQSVLCKPCIQTAVNKVAELGEWHPAIQDGIFVKSTVVVPVHFKTGATQGNH